MKVVPFEKLASMNLAVSDIAVIYQIPSWKRLNLKSRRINGFLLIDRGSCSYAWENGQAQLQEGSLIYLPHGSKHSVYKEQEPFSYYRLSFTVTDMEDGEIVLFSSVPKLVAQRTGKEFFENADSLMQITMSKPDVFRSSALLCEFLSDCVKLVQPVHNSKIAAAIEYIESNYTKKFDVSTLASLCFLSEAQFFRLFKKEVGTSPVEYRNKIRIRWAKKFLADKGCNISEISSMLGFESVYYFSRVFHQFEGISPTEYRNTILSEY